MKLGDSSKAAHSPDTFGVGSNVFFYGTLRSGQSNHRIVEGRAELLGEATYNQAVMYSLGAFPALCLIDEITDMPIKGEVFRVTSEDLPQRLDYLEGYPSFYDRKEVSVLLQYKPTTAWVYYLRGKVLDEPVIKSGDWLNRGEAPYTRSDRHANT